MQDTFLAEVFGHSSLQMRPLSLGASVYQAFTLSQSSEITSALSA